MSRRILIIDDSALIEVVSTALASNSEEVCVATSLAGGEHLVMGAQLVAIHTSVGKGSRASLTGIELAKQLRRDLRYKGGIILYAIQTLESLCAQGQFFYCVRDTNAGTGGVSFFSLPEEFEGMRSNALLTATHNLTDQDLLKFVLEFCDLEQYFRRGWGDVAHLVQAREWGNKLVEPKYRFLLQNTKDFGQLYVDSRQIRSDLFESGTPKEPPPEVDEALSALGLLDLPILNHDSLTESVGLIQVWLETVPTDPRSQEGIALPEYSFVLIADDDPFEARQMEKLGYRVEQVNDPQTAKELLSEREHSVFMCDLRWWGQKQIGLELIEEALSYEVPIIIAMSASGIDVPLPKDVMPCEGIKHKHDIGYIHGLIVKRAKEIQQCYERERPIQ